MYINLLSIVLSLKNSELDDPCLDRMRRNKEYREARSVRNMNKIKEDLDIKNRVSPYNELTICLSVCLIWFSFTGSVADPH